MISRKLSVLSLGLVLLSSLARPAQAQETLKFASLAPDGSTWMKLFRDWGRAVEEKSGGKLKIKFFAGGQAGDERDVVRKIKLGQLSGAAVTSIGLGLIQSEIRVLELPLMVQTYEELTFLRDKMDQELRRKFEERDFVLLAWSDVGPVHIFSNTPLRTRSDVDQTKMWAWSDDPLVKAMLSKMGMASVPLGVPDVLPSLQTGMINACYGSPLSTLALQWHTKVKYMTSMIIDMGIGATVVHKKVFDKLAPEQKKALMDTSTELQEKLSKMIRADNDKALLTMKGNGLQVIETPKALRSEFEAAALAVRGDLELKDGKGVYSHPLRVKVEQHLAEYRAGKK